MSEQCTRKDRGVNGVWLGKGLLRWQRRGVLWQVLEKDYIYYEVWLKKLTVQVSCSLWWPLRKIHFEGSWVGIPARVVILFVIIQLIVFPQINTFWPLRANIWWIMGIGRNGCRSSPPWRPSARILASQAAWRRRQAIPLRGMTSTDLS